MPHIAAPVPPLDAGAAHGPDPWGGWFNASEDPTVGRLPKRDKPAHRFKTRNLDAASMPHLMEGSEFAMFRKLWSPEIVAMCVKHTNLRLAKLRAKDVKPVSYHQDITDKELWLWQGLTMVMGICRLPSVELYWSKQHYGEWEFFVAGRSYPTQTLCSHSSPRHVPSLCPSPFQQLHFSTSRRWACRATATSPSRHSWPSCPTGRCLTRTRRRPSLTGCGGFDPCWMRCKSASSTSRLPPWSSRLMR